MNTAPKGEYWDFSWNPVTGCLYEGECKKFCHCRPLARRFGKTADEKAFNPALHQERLREPVDRKKPARIFVCLNGDLWGKEVENGYHCKRTGKIYPDKTKRPDSCIEYPSGDQR